MDIVEDVFFPMYLARGRVDDDEDGEHLNLFWDLFRLCPPPPPSLVGAYYLHPPDARAIFLHNGLLCNGTCSVTGGRITYWGGHKRKRSLFCCYYRRPGSIPFVTA